MELPQLCKCMEYRERNEIYKTWSIGYRGEAYSSLAKSSSLTIITKHSKSDFAWVVTYNCNGDISNITQNHDVEEVGTTIQVRDMHKNNDDHRKRYYGTI